MKKREYKSKDAHVGEMLQDLVLLDRLNILHIAETATKRVIDKLETLKQETIEVQEGLTNAINRVEELRRREE